MSSAANDYMGKMKDGKYCSAVDKLLIINAWDSFLKNGLKEGAFTRRLYSYLMNQFGFIAHYNREGFLNERFRDYCDIKDTFNQILNAERYYFDDARTEYADLNRAVRDLTEKHCDAVLAVFKQKKIRELEVQSSLAAQMATNLRNSS